ncbi:MAG: hypothetical protein EZS28_033683 [Streblomastix strix]|uniref:Uncharacterized protein n=1 Tax=Streblomastix strix TaxID=222440 RepID=A0A5J4UJR0_9EUKA|nr:MAG: hypothetical protein EZS28_033683 [Streblomastix strix]
MFTALNGVSWETFSMLPLLLFTILAFMVAAGAASGLIIAVGVALIVVSVGLLAIAIAMLIMSSIDNDCENFKKAMNNVLSIFTDSDDKKNVDLGWFIVASIALAIGFGFLAVTAAVLMMITSSEYDEKNVEGFTNSLSTIVTEIGKIPWMKAVKAMAKAAVMGTMFVLIKSAAEGFKIISETKYEKDTVIGFAEFLEAFVNILVEKLSGNVIKSVKDVEPGLEALGMLINVSSGLANIVSNFANMQIGEYEVRNGKFVLVRARKFNPDKDIKAVSENIGVLLGALIDPLMELSSNNDEWTFGGITVKNPFKGGWFGTDDTSGAERLRLIGDAFGSLSTSINTFATSEMFANKENLAKFTVGFGSVMEAMVLGFAKLNTLNLKIKKNSIDTISRFFDKFDTDGINKFEKFEKSLTSFVSVMSDEAKWNSLNKNLETSEKNIEKIVKTINTIDIQKATLFQSNLKLLTEMKSAKALEEVAAKLKEVIETITGAIEKYEAHQKDPNAPLPTAPPVEEKQTLIEKITDKFKNKKEETVETGKDIAGEYETTFNNILEQLNGINSKLSNKLKVVFADKNANSMDKQIKQSHIIHYNKK